MKFSDQMKASRALGAKDYPTVIRYYEAEIENDSHDPMALFMLARAHERLGQSDRALEFATKALAVEPHDFEMLLVAARYWANKDPHRTYDYVNKIIENPPAPPPKFATVIGTIVEFLAAIVKRRRNMKGGMESHEAYIQESLNWAQGYKVWYNSKYGAENEPTKH